MIYIIDLFGDINSEFIKNGFAFYPSGSYFFEELKRQIKLNPNRIKRELKEICKPDWLEREISREGVLFIDRGYIHIPKFN